MTGAGGIFDLAWMAWTWQTALFFLFIFGSIAAMGIWEYYVPGGSPRRGIFGLDTTRGDRLFIGLLGAAWIHLGWLFGTEAALWWGSVVALAWFLVVMRFG